MKSICLLAAVFVASLSSIAEATAQEFVVIVNPSVPGSSIERKTVGDIYLRQMGQWPNGALVAPIDQSVKAPLRTRFSEIVFGQPVAWVTNYWSRRMTGGLGWPPPVKSSDADVVAEVRKTRGAIGYVSADFSLDETVKVLKILD